MINDIVIITCNSKFENGKCIGGYHEIHKINVLKNFKHLVSTVNNIISNNIIYGCDDTILEEILVQSCDDKIVDKINEYFVNYGIPVYGELSIS